MPKHPSDEGASTTPLRKTRSVDFSRIRGRSSFLQRQEASHIASTFSRRAARGSYTSTSSGLLDSKEGAPPTSYPEDPLDASWDQQDPLLTSTESWSSTDSSSEEAPANIAMRIPIGKLSVILLLLVTVTDLALCQMHHLDSLEIYDALSTEVIRPPFSYSSNKAVKPRMGLGSAAISTVTEKLSPILPFAGGMDLRRQDYWTNKNGSWFETVQSVCAQIRDAFHTDTETEEATSMLGPIPRGGGNVPGKLFAKLSSRRTKTKHVSTLSAQQPFVPLEAIGDLTLGDVAETFRYAVESGKEGFNEARFLNGQLPRVKKVLTAMQDAVSKSRGKDVKPSLISTKAAKAGQIDALKFGAAMRVFAEWRVLRQVPEGYKGFSVGMELGRKDIVQNVAKIEKTVHSWLDQQRDLMDLQAQWEKEAPPGESCPIDGSPSELRSPTLREILRHEIDMGVHPSLPRLKEKSGSMGVLWVRRQLHYQTASFGNILKVPNRFSSTKDAVSAAYGEVYDRYHGWAVQKIFSYSFQSSPEASEIYKFMNPHRLKDVLASAQRLKSSDSTSDLPLMSSGSEPSNDNPLEGFLRHVGGEWEKLVNSVGQIFGGGSPSSEQMKMRGGDGLGISSKEHDDFVTQEMIKDAHDKIAIYLDVARPLLEDLADVFDEFNMDDPTRV